MTTANRKLYAYTVKARMRFSAFPLDMLRYDRAWPDGPDDVLVIGAPIENRPESDITVRLVGVSEPTIGRWESFGWRVIELKAVRP
jgi:hypothetical protein